MARTYKARPSRTISIPPPIGGWNARDSLAAMSSKDAVTLQNCFPQTTDVMFRQGYLRHAYGFTGQCETILWYSGGASNKLFTIESGKIWNITAGGDYSAGSPDVTGLLNSRFQSINFTNAAGVSFMLNVNAANKLQGYDGTSWYVDGDGSHDITGFDTSQASNINLHKSRIWFTQKNTLAAYYLPTNTVAGAASKFDLSGIARLGGYITEMAAWTIDAGYGVDDLAVFITSNGEIIVYKGTDPASPTTWALVGIWQIGTPIGSRCAMKWAGDLLIITQDGLVPMAQGLQSSRLDPRVNLTDKIQSAVSLAATLYSENFGWDLLYYAKQNMLILNIPVAEGSQQQQYVMNTISKSWCNFTDVNANCWSLYNDDEPYFGGNGFVGKFWQGFTDFPTATGVNINITALQAFNYCGMPGMQKQYRMIRPTLNTNGQPSIFMNINVDFDLSNTTAQLAYSPTSGALWDVALWDQAIWSGGLQIQKSWQGANGIGYCMAPSMTGASMGIETHWMATDVVFADGGTL